MKPDLGLYFIAKGEGSAMHYFARVPITHLTRVDAQWLTTMVIVTREGIEHALSLDLSAELLAALALVLPAEVGAVLIAVLERLAVGQTEELSVPIGVNIGARVRSVQQGPKERFAPLVVQTIEPAQLSEEQLLDRALGNCDLAYARVTLVEMFAGAVIDKALAALLDRFVDQPCDDNARALLRFNPSLMVVFVNNRDAKSFRESHGMDVSRPRRNSALMRMEPDFPALVAAFVDDPDGFLRLKQDYVARGYTPQVITEGITGHFADLS